MPRVTVNISEDAEEWLETESERLNWSKAKAGGHCIEVMHSTSDHINPMQSEVGADADVHHLEERLSEVEERLGSLEATTRPREARVEELGQSPSEELRRAEEPRERAESVPEAEGADTLRDEMERALDELDIPGRGKSVVRARREAVRWAWEHLREHEHLKSRELANAAFGAFWDERTGYSTSPRYAGYGMWDGYLRDAMKQLPGVDGAAERGEDWYFSR